MQNKPSSEPCAKQERSDNDNIIKMLLPSIAGIVICMVFFVGLSWAWYSSSIQSSPQTLLSANYTAELAVQIGDTPLQSVGGSFALDADAEYTVTITAGGTASTGYCVLHLGSESYYTTQISKDSSITFTLIPQSAESFSCSAIWGSYSGTPSVTDGTVIGSRSTPEPDAAPTTAAASTTAPTTAPPTTVPTTGTATAEETTATPTTVPASTAATSAATAPTEATAAQ